LLVGELAGDEVIIEDGTDIMMDTMVEMVIMMAEEVEMTMGIEVILEVGMVVEAVVDTMAGMEVVIMAADIMAADVKLSCKRESLL
jgi:hypothetical protein